MSKEFKSFYDSLRNYAQNNSTKYKEKKEIAKTRNNKKGINGRSVNAWTVDHKKPSFNKLFDDFFSNKMHSKKSLKVYTNKGNINEIIKTQFSKYHNKNAKEFQLLRKLPNVLKGG